MRFQYIAEQLYCRPWLITPSAYSTLVKIFEARMLSPRADSLEDDIALFANKREELDIDENGIAHISIFGPIGKGISKIERSCGVTGIEDVHADLDELEGVARGLMVHFNSPGGTVVGVPELAQRFADLRIPTAGFTDDLQASAAYYLSAGLNHLTATPSSDVGSIGVIIPWVDDTEVYESAGIKLEAIRNKEGDLKGIGWPPRLTDAQREYLEESVQEVFDDFRGFITDFRNIDKDAMRGQTLSGVRALQAGLIDSVGSYADAYAELLSRVNG